jgi:DNA polymerase-3 subunit delta
VYLLVGQERVLAERAVAAIRKATLAGSAAGFNEDRLTAPDVDIEQVVNAARTAPMLAPRRFVLLRAIDRWEASADAAGGSSAARGTAALDRLAAYAAAPVDSTVLVATATGLDGRRKLAVLAKKQGFLVSCDPIRRNALPAAIERAAGQRGHRVEAGVAELLAEIAGPELGPILDAVERLSLYVGEGASISEDAVAACVTRVRPSTTWELVDAVSRRDAATALAKLHAVFDPRDRGLPLVGVLAWSVRQLTRFAAARKQGASVEAAARQAGVPEFKVREVAQTVARIQPGELERWLLVLAETDLALKGSRRPPRAILEAAILTMAITISR